MTNIRRLTAAGLAFTALTWAVLGAGCGETGDTDPTPVQTFKITPAGNATAAPEATAETTAPTVPPTVPDGASGASTIEIAGVNSTFDVEDVTAPAGTVTIDFANRDSGVVHNIHVFRGSDNEGESVAETDLEPGPIDQSVTFDAEPGEYYYVCDAHPTTMEGTLIVE